MKSITESIIGRKGSPARFTKDMLRSGYIVKYLNESFAMYFEYEDAVRITRTRSCGPRMNGEGGFFSRSLDELIWMPVCRYNVNLTHTGSTHTGIIKGLNIVTVWPVKTYPQLLDQASLEHLTKGVAPIKINQ